MIIFVYRAVPTPGQGSTWWMIDELGILLITVTLLVFALPLIAVLIVKRTRMQSV